MIPTVRVAHPRDPSSYMTINAIDYREMVHGPLWPVQAEGFTGLPAPKPQSMDPAVRDFATAFMVDIMDMRQAEKGQPSFSSLSPAEQLSMLRADHAEMKEARDRYHRHTQVSEAQAAAFSENMAYEDRLAAQRAVVVPEGVVVGETPGWPMDNASGLPLALTDAERAKLAAAGPLPAPGDATGAATSQDAFERTTVGQADAASQTPATPAWAAQPVPATPPNPPVEDLAVSKGPGNKWYVMRGNSPVTEGFATKAEAETAKANVPAA
jgi:hypothetical protein